MAKQVKIDIVARDKTKKAIASSKKGLGGLKKFALAAGAALATIGAGKAILGLVQTGKEIESLQVRFKILFGSAKEGAKAFDTLSSFAAKVPFSLGDIAAASGNLAVVAKDAKELNDILEITGNVAGATGLDFQTTASQIQRAFSGGIASADVFREKGVRDMLGFSAGAKVSVEETIAAFKKAFAGNGEFAGTTKALAKTLEGNLSMISDKFLQFKLAINEAFFEELKTQFTDLNKTLDENRDVWLGLGRDIGKSLAGALKETVETLALLNSIIGVVERSTEAVSGGFLNLQTIMALLAPDLFLIAQGMKGFNETNQDVTKGLDELLAVVEPYHDNIMRIAEGYGVLTEATNNATTAQDALNASYDAANQKSIALFKSKERDVIVERKASSDKKKLNQDTFNQAKKFAAAGAAQSKKMFRLQQGLAIGEAAINTFNAASAALKQPPGPPFTFPLVALTVATGMAQIAGIRSQQPPAQFGGARQSGTPFLVGEKGPELFTPTNAGTVTPNHQLGGGGATVNFNITTVDAQSFGNLLDTRRGQIVNMINSALNNKGQAALV